MPDPRLTTAAALSRHYRALADAWWDRDPEVWGRFTDQADRLAAMPPETVIPNF